MGAGVPRGLQNRLREAQNLPDEFDSHTLARKEGGGSAGAALLLFVCGTPRYLNGKWAIPAANVVIDTLKLDKRRGIGYTPRSLKVTKWLQ